MKYLFQQQILFSLVSLPLYALPLEFSKNLEDSLRSTRQSSSTSLFLFSPLQIVEDSPLPQFGGEKTVPSHHSVACIGSTAAAPLLQLVFTGSAWQLDLESGCGSIKTFNKIILKEKTNKQTNSSCSGLTIDLCSQATPLGPGSPAFKVMHMSTSE